jgi:anti-sigma28 factor (negative regulator of flagellin synthesis)
VQELQQAVERGTYHVSAEQLADKMLQETLREVL